MKVKEIAFVAYPAEDPDKLFKFYRDVIGLKPAKVYPEEGPVQFVEFQVGPDSWFSIMPTSFAQRPAGTGVGVAFEVEDIEAALKEVKGHARSAEDANDSPVCKYAAVEDPEGNRIMFHEMKPA